MALTKIPGTLIQTGAITAAALDDDAVTTAKVLDANITHAKLHATMDLTGKTVTVATAAGSTNTTAAASTAFVQQELTSGLAPKATIASPTFTGTPSAPTASGGTNTTALASTAFVQQEITTLIGGAPSTLNDLNELAAAINDDANYNTTLTTALATKLPLAGGTMTGNLTVQTLVGINKAVNSSVGLSVGSDAASATSYGLEVTNNSSNTRFLVDGLGSQRFYGSDNAETARFTDGKLLIGTTSTTPGYALDLIGATNYRSLLIGQSEATGTKRQAIAARHYTSSEQPHNMIGMFTDSNTNSILTIGGGLGATGDFNSVTEIQLHTGNGTTVNTTAAMTIDATGNVGIGTTTPASFSNQTSLTVQGTSIGRVDVKGAGGAGGGALLAWSEGMALATNSNWPLEIGVGVSYITFKTSGAERMRIDSSGNVLVGTTSNNYNRGKFTVFGTPGNPATTGANADNVAIRVATTTGNSQSFDIGMYNTSPYGAWLQSHNSGALDSHSPIILNPNGGNVGIGTSSPTTAPSGAFTWASPATTIAGSRPALYLNGSSSYTTIRMWPSGTDGASTTVDDWHVNTAAGGTSAGRLSFQPQGGALSAAGLSLKPDGKVGIGTFTPEANLHVFNNTNTVNNVGSLGFDVSASIGNNATNPGNHYSSGIRIFQGSGSIGSGLGVFNIGVDNGTATTANQYTAHLIAPTGMTGGITFQTDGLETARIRKYNSSCNILIGAIEPTHTRSDDSSRNKLYVQGTYPVISIIGGDNGNANHGPTLQFGNQTSGNEHWVIGSGNTTAQLDFGWGNPSDHNPHHGIAGYGASGSSGQTKMRITSAGVGVGGNWGVYGTVTNPAYPLHVQGTASATQYNRGAIEMGTIIEHIHQKTGVNHQLSGSTTSWTDTGLTKTVTPQSAKSYFWVEMYHNEHINPNTPNYGGGLRLLWEARTEIARGGEMEYQAGTWASGADYRYNGNAKTWGGWYNPQTASAIAFTAQAAAPNSPSW